MAGDLDDGEDERAGRRIGDPDPDAMDEPASAEQLQAQFRAVNESSNSVVDDLLAERRAEAELEERYAAFAAALTDDDLRIARAMRGRRARRPQAMTGELDTHRQGLAELPESDDGGSSEH